LHPLVSSSALRVVLPEDVLTDNKEVHLSTRRVEAHTLSIPLSHSFYLLFQRFPIWLLCLELSWTSTVFILGYVSRESLLLRLRVLQIPTGLLERALDRLGVDRVVYLGSLSLPLEFAARSILLISGDLHFVDTETQRLSWVAFPVIGTLDHHFYQRFRGGLPQGLVSTSNNVLWIRIRHEAVGGASTFRGVHAVCNVGKTVHPEGVSLLRRTLSHIVNFGVRPAFLADPNQSPDSLTLLDRISPGNWKQQVRFATHFSSSGWGIRSLTPDELGSVFGLSIALS
jgi:hypothetical protein